MSVENAVDRWVIKVCRELTAVGIDHSEEVIELSRVGITS